MPAAKASFGGHRGGTMDAGLRRWEQWRAALALRGRPVVWCFPDAVWAPDVESHVARIVTGDERVAVTPSGPTGIGLSVLAGHRVVDARHIGPSAPELDAMAAGTVLLGPADTRAGLPRVVEYANGKFVWLDGDPTLTGTVRKVSAELIKTGSAVRRPDGYVALATVSIADPLNAHNEGALPGLGALIELRLADPVSLFEAR